MRHLKAISVLASVMLVAAGVWAADTAKTELVQMAKATTTRSRMAAMKKAAGGPWINAFWHNTSGWIKPGDQIIANLEGAPNGVATFGMPGVTDRLPMKWGDPKRYGGMWTCPEVIRDVQGARVVGELKKGGKTKIIQSRSPVNIDTIEPAIQDMQPMPDAMVAQATPTISVAFHDNAGSGVAPKFVKLTVDGQDVTSDANVTPCFVSYKPSSPLAAGMKSVTVSLEDKARNTASKSWTFTVREDAQAIKSVTYTAPDSVGPDDTISVRVEGEAGGKANFWFVVPGINPMGSHSMEETSPGVYTADYTVRQGSDLRGARVVASVTTASGETYSREADQTIAGKAVPLTPPEITEPQNATKVASPLIITGTSVPGGRVRLRITYTSLDNGKLCVNGTLFDQMLTTDESGSFQSDSVDLGIMIPRKTTEFTLKAMSVGFDGAESAPKIIKFKRQ